jgi:hypothetical protein
MDAVRSRLAHVAAFRERVQKTIGDHIGHKVVKIPRRVGVDMPTVVRRDRVPMRLGDVLVEVGPVHLPHAVEREVIMLTQIPIDDGIVSWQDTIDKFGRVVSLSLSSMRELLDHDHRGIVPFGGNEQPPNHTLDLSL